MSRTVSPFVKRPYGVVRVCEELELPRSTFYAARKRVECPARPAERRGPKTALSDEQLTGKIREVLEASVFVGEGHRKVWARLRNDGVRTSRGRVLRLMREAGLLAPARSRRQLGPRHHDGSIVTDRPDTMWGTDLTTTMTVREGQAAVFVAVDHCTAEAVGIHAAERATRFEALDVIRQGVRERFGSYEAGVAAGLALRHDNGSQYVSRVFQQELAFLGIESTPAFVKAPQGNGCAERFIRTLKEQLLWVRSFETVEELRQALHDFRHRYNRAWLIERHGHLSPAAHRERLQAGQEAA